VAGDEKAEDTVALGPKVAEIGRYRLVAELARGGMGIVYLALVRGPGGFNKLFVVKVLKGHLAEDRRLVAMFLEEARLAAKLSHPNVVQTIEVGSDDGRHFIAMEFLDGQSFHRALTRSRRAGPVMPLEVQLSVLVHLLEGLQYAHTATDFDGTPMSLVHRDVSPQNVFLTYDGQVKVLDFGIAKALGSTHDTNTGMLKGKIAYMGPEQAAGEPLDGRADVFSVGVMLWETVVGERMWRTLNDMQILHGLMQGSIPRPSDVKPDVDPRIQSIIVKATAPAAPDRHASAAELQADLEAYMKAAGLPAIGPRELGRFVGEMFAAERAEIRSAIDAQLRILSATSSGSFNRIDMPRLSPHTMSAGTPSGIVASSALDLPRLPPPIEMTPVPLDGGSPLVRAPVALPAKTRAGRWWGAAAVLTLLVAAVAGAAVMLGHTPTSPTTTPATTASSTAEAPRAPAATGAASASAAAAAPAASAIASESASPVEPAAPAESASATTRSARPHGPAGGQAPWTPSAAVAPVPTSTAAPAPTSTATTRVRQQIDTSNPYGH
jgi:serine/threonine-protein kinase